MPENRNARNPAYLNERVRGTGGFPTSFGEENLLSLPIDRYDDESIGVHEFCHTIDSTLARIDPTWRERKNAAYQERGRSKGLFKDTYAGSNAGEYWAEIAQAYFDCNRINNWNHGPIGHREQLKIYDPEGYELVRDHVQPQSRAGLALQLPPEATQRHRPAGQVQDRPVLHEVHLGPRVHRDRARGQRRGPAPGQRHDPQDVRLSPRHPQGTDRRRREAGRPGPRREASADLPECKKAQRRRGHHRPHWPAILDYSPEIKLLVVGQENVLADPGDPYVRDNQVIRVFAKAIYHVTGTRPVDPNWENRRPGCAAVRVARPAAGRAIRCETQGTSMQGTGRRQVARHAAVQIASTTGPRVCWPTSTPWAQDDAPTMPPTRSTRGRPSRNTTPTCSPWSTRRWPTKAKSTGDTDRTSGESPDEGEQNRMQRTGVGCHVYAS